MGGGGPGLEGLEEWEGVGGRVLAERNGEEKAAEAVVGVKELEGSKGGVKPGELRGQVKGRAVKVCAQKCRTAREERLTNGDSRGRDRRGCFRAGRVGDGCEETGEERELRKKADGSVGKNRLAKIDGNGGVFEEQQREQGGSGVELRKAVSETAGARIDGEPAGGTEGR